MGIVKGFTSVAGWKKSTTWGTAVAVGAAEGIRFTKLDPGADLQFLPSDELSGSRSRLAGDRGNILHDPNLETEMHYEGLERILAQAMGTAGAPSQVGGDDAYTHTFKMKNELDGIHGTLVAYLQSKPAIIEYDNVKVNGFNFSVGAGNQKASMSFPMIARKRVINEGSGTNTNTTAGSITYVSNRDFVNFAAMAVRINTTSGGTLGTSDLVYPSELSITLNNNLPSDDVTAAHAPYVDEPIGGGWGEVSVSMTLTKGYQDLTLLSEMISETAVEKKMDVIFTGPVADGAANFSLSFFLPSLQFQGDLPGIDGPDRQSETFNFAGNRVATSPTGFTSGYTDAVTIDLVNQRATDALA